MSIRNYDSEYTVSVTDFDEAEPRDSQDRPQEITRQGPLRAGEQMNLGTFRSLLRQTASRHKDLLTDETQLLREIDVDNFKITVIASYGPEGGVIGASRKFLVRGERNEFMRPVAINTKRMTRRSARKRLEGWLEQQIDQATSSSSK